MASAQVFEIIGFIASGIAIIMFMPQAIQVWKTKETKSISSPSFLLISFSAFLWTIYGLFLSSTQIVLANTVILILSLYILLMKLRHG